MGTVGSLSNCASNDSTQGLDIQRAGSCLLHLVTLRANFSLAISPELKAIVGFKINLRELEANQRFSYFPCDYSVGFPT
jgi:hypothetical protein